MTSAEKGKATRLANVAHKAHMAELRAKAAATVKTGVCPVCRTKLVRNSAIAGWYQCGAYACESFRSAEFKGLPSCSFQCFTE